MDEAASDRGAPDLEMCFEKRRDHIRSVWQKPA
jgi:hypothetical protein